MQCHIHAKTQCLGQKNNTLVSGNAGDGKYLHQGNRKKKKKNPKETKKKKKNKFN